MIPIQHRINSTTTCNIRNRRMKANTSMTQKQKHMQLVVQLLMFVATIFVVSNFIQMRTITYDALTSMSSPSADIRSLNWHDHIDTMSRQSDITTTTQHDEAETTNSESTSHYYYNEIPQRKPHIQKDLVQAGDYIYYFDEESWNAAPIVIESHKLLFFTIPKVGCTVWKQLFRRMMNYTDWTSQDYEVFQPHNPQVNGLTYLYNYTLEEASVMMTSPDWTRAMMVRDPKQRFLSAFLDKAVGNYHKHILDRCCPDGSCIENAQSIPGFLALCSKCDDNHWRPQASRIDYKYWPYMDSILHVETAASDAKQLLQRIGAWDEYGQSGWGENGQSSIFASKVGSGMNHSTYAEYQVWTWYTPESEQLVERFYQGDYENPLFQFNRNECLTCVD